jgi:hypothetical protein
MAGIDRLEFSFTVNGNKIVKDYDNTADGQAGIGPVTVPGPSTNLGVNMSFAYAKLSLFLMLIDVDATVKFNSSGSPTETITLKANKPFIWFTGCGYANPFANNCTEIFITIGGSVNANFYAKVNQEALAA